MRQRRCSGRCRTMRSGSSPEEQTRKTRPPRECAACRSATVVVRTTPTLRTDCSVGAYPARVFIPNKLGLAEGRSDAALLPLSGSQCYWRVEGPSKTWLASGSSNPSTLTHSQGMPAPQLNPPYQPQPCRRRSCQRCRRDPAFAASVRRGCARWRRRSRPRLPSRRDAPAFAPDQICPIGIGDALPRDVRRRAMHRLEQRGKSRSGLMLPEGAIPMVPAQAGPRSDRMSPNRFEPPPRRTSPDAARSCAVRISMWYLSHHARIAWPSPRRARPSRAS